MDKYVIDKGVPLPQEKANSFIGILRKMQIGDSLVAPADKARASHTAARRLNVKFIIRPEDGMPGMSRIWRVE